MTVKLNLTPLINYFSDKNSTIASRLQSLTKVAEEGAPKFESAFLGDEGLKDMIDNCSEETLSKCKDELAKVIKESSKFNNKSKISHLKEVMNISNPKALKFFFYNYLLAASGNKVLNIASQKRSLNKVAEALIEIANELDTSDPELASEADSILKDLVRQASCGSMEMGHVHSEKCMGSPSSAPVIAPMGGHFIMDEKEDMPEDVEIVRIEDLKDPDIYEPSEPEPEFDEVSLEDLDDRLSGLKWRIADKHRREALEKAKEHATKAKEYYDAFRRYKNKTHSIFDEAGEALRLKDFE
jgi:hypothetical protein